MNIKTGKGFSSLVDKGMSILEKDNALMRGISDSEFSIGFESDAQFAVPASAADGALFVGDSWGIGEKHTSAMIESMLKNSPEKVQMRPVWNNRTQKFDINFCIAGDTGFDPIAGQAFSPWNITYLSKVWKEPLGYSNARELIKKESAGNNMFAELFTLFLEQYAGWGVIGQSGTFQNNMTNDVNVKNGIASFPIINLMGTYTVTLREQQQANWGAIGSSPIARKQSYLNYVFDMMEAILMIYGNEETNTPGLLDINPIEVWTQDSIKEIFKSNTNTTRGSAIYRLLADVINDFLTKADNKFSEVVVGLSPEAYNYVQSAPYSDNYSPEAAMRTFSENYLAGKGLNGTTPSVRFVVEPLIKANSELNSNPFDYVVISAPTIDGGPDREKQATNFYASVVDKFTFPAIPNMYNTQYKTMRRTAGVIAPIPAAVKVYAGLGVK